MTKGHTIRLKTDDGAEEIFEVLEVETSTKVQHKGVANLTDSLAGLAIGPKDGFEIYEMDWRTKVIVGDEEVEAHSAQKDSKAQPFRSNVRRIDLTYGLFGVLMCASQQERIVIHPVSQLTSTSILPPPPPRNRPMPVSVA